MKRSFRLHLFIRIFLATGVIILVNRYFAQYHLFQQMKQETYQELARVALDCGSAASEEGQWLSCAKGPQKGEVLYPLIDFFVPCIPNAPGLEWDEVSCTAAQNAPIAWKQMNVHGQSVQYGEVSIQDRLWQVSKLTNSKTPAMVMVSDDSLRAYMKKIWALRDRNLIYVLPTIFLMLLGLTAYMVYVVMRPIRLMEETLSTLDFKNMRERNKIQTPYVEFKKLANVYRDLLVRLDESYENAKRFASDAAHELRTPLSILRGNVERLIPEVPNGSELQMHFQSLGDEVDRLIVITEKLLMLSRADSNSLSLDIEPVDLSRILNDLIEDAESFHAHIRFINHVDAGIVWHCDKALIEQLINNLYSNAIKYNVPKDGWIEFTLRHTGQELVLSVRNSSSDVPAELSEKAFERFYRSDASRTRRNVDGLGLGLSICKEIAQVHQGSISLTVPAHQEVAVEFRAPWQVRSTS